MKQIFCITFVLASVLLFACEDEDEIEPSLLNYSYDFKNDLEGWTVGFADYPVGEEDFYELNSAHMPLPFPLNENKKALMVEGNNHSDDLFMFISKKISGLDSSTTYDVKFTVELASNYPESWVGIGGGPGSSVYLKAGISQTQPQTFEKEGMWELNMDKGNQSEGGKEMLVLGHIGTSREDEQYVLFTHRQTKENTLTLKTDKSGEAWLIVGTDSGFEGKTRLYYNKVTVSLKETDD
ncbi:hypothetical protein PZB74_14305 [Porifericola rhodea]|uniref:hypothetical protein n=1 Tax=Porifericola rhodea TaxID=930972 RepID=UPI00266550A4|nr:hypothetical protein [Porifericola rhodea]WKN30134.1 hypothetical protein PZB74_14305 [Porifericola rhodea]